MRLFGAFGNFVSRQSFDTLPPVSPDEIAVIDALYRLGTDDLSLIARTMLQRLREQWDREIPSAPTGLVGMTVSGQSLAQLMNRIHGLRSLDPAHMQAGDVGLLLDYLSEHHSDVFENTAAELAWENPSLRPALFATQPVRDLPIFPAADDLTN